MQRTSRVGVEALDRVGELLHQLGRERVARLGPVQPAAGATWPSTLVSTSGLTRRRAGGVIALIPVASRPMISFWICEVPS